MLTSLEGLRSSTPFRSGLRNPNMSEEQELLLILDGETGEGGELNPGNRKLAGSAHSVVALEVSLVKDVAAVRFSCQEMKSTLWISAVQR